MAAKSRKADFKPKPLRSRHSKLIHAAELIDKKVDEGAGFGA